VRRGAIRCWRSSPRWLQSASFARFTDGRMPRRSSRACARPSSSSAACAASPVRQPRTVVLARDAYGAGLSAGPEAAGVGRGTRVPSSAVSPYRARSKGKVERFNGFLRALLVPAGATLKAAGLIGRGRGQRARRGWLVRLPMRERLRRPESVPFGVGSRAHCADAAPCARRSQCRAHCIARSRWRACSFRCRSTSVAQRCGMNLQHERFALMCAQMKLERIGADWSHLAQQARVSVELADFLERVLGIEREAARERLRQTLPSSRRCRPSRRSSSTTSVRHRAPRAQLQELASLAFVERPRTWCCWVPAGVGKSHPGDRAGVSGAMARNQDALHHGGLPDAQLGTASAGAAEGVLQPRRIGPRLPSMSSATCRSARGSEPAVQRRGQTLRALEHDPHEQPAVRPMGREPRRRSDAHRALLVGC